jgi:phage shock protein A
MSAAKRARLDLRKQIAAWQEQIASLEDERNALDGQLKSGWGLTYSQLRALIEHQGERRKKIRGSIAYLKRKIREKERQ